MSTFERSDFQWRETYFVFFAGARRPKLSEVERRLRKLNARFELQNPTADEEGLFESLTVMAPDDFAALDISYMAGEEVIEQGAQLYKELKGPSLDDDERARLARVPKLDAKFDLMHFEQVGAAPAAADDEPEEMLDPDALLIVLDALVELTKGVGIDPQSGSLV